MLFCFYEIKMLKDAGSSQLGSWRHFSSQQLIEIGVHLRNANRMLTRNVNTSTEILFSRKWAVLVISLV